MMANMIQDLAAGLLNGAAKPAIAAQGEGIDFAALLAGADPAKIQSPGQALAALARPSAAAIPEQTVIAEVDARASVIAKPKEEARAASPSPVAQLLAGIEALPKRMDGQLSSPARQAQPSTPARSASMASALPQMAMAGRSEIIEASVETDTPAAAEQNIAPEGQPSPLEGPAQPVLNAQPAADKPGQQAANAAPALAHASPAPAAPAASRSPAIAAVIQSAVQPPPIRSSAAEKPAVARPEMAPAPRAKAAPVASSSRQAIALELAASSLVQSRAGEAMPATADTSAAPAPIAPAPIPGIAAPSPAPPLTSLEAAMPPIEAPAPLASALPAADTAAMLGEQVIDMGVEGQWIDRMAREITQIAAGTGRASFILNPEHLGRLQVEILQHDAGADVRLIAETDDAAAALSQGRQQLQQDARLQAVRIHDVQVERAPAERSSDAAPSARTGGTGQDLAGQQQQSQSSPKKPLIEAVSSPVTLDELDQAAGERTGSQSARYA